MPEGDTVHKLAAALGLELAGQEVRLMLASGVRSRVSAHRVTSVSARGKHLLIEFADGMLLRTHLGLYGSWHRYRPGESWQKPARSAAVVLETVDRVFVCFHAKEAEIVPIDGVQHRTLQTRLRIDLLAPAVDLTVIPGRAEELLDADTPIVDVLLDQRVACGIGNVYKSELLFLEGLHPRVRLGAVTHEALVALYGNARELLLKNLGGGPRVTRFIPDGAGVLWVYRRKGLPCFRCDAPIRGMRMGKDWRSTYWCPGCQRGA